VRGHAELDSEGGCGVEADRVSVEVAGLVSPAAGGDGPGSAGACGRRWLVAEMWLWPRSVMSHR